MSRFFSIAIPSMLVGGLMFGSAFTRADAGPDAGLGFWPTTSTRGIVLAQVAPTPPTPPTPPKAPKPPKNGISVTIKDGKVDISGIDETINEQIENAKNAINGAPLSADVKAKLLAKLEKTRSIVKKRLQNTKNMTPEEIGEQMGQLGEDIGSEMEEFGEEMAKFGDQMSKQFDHKPMHHKKSHSSASDDDNDSDNDDDDTAGAPMAPAVAIDTDDDDDMKAAIKDLGDLALKPAQRDAITKLRKDSDKTVDEAKKQLDALSNKLHDALGNPTVTDADVSKYVDQISAQEAAIRKARLIAWVNARRVLDDAQRKRVEDAAKKKTK